MGGSGVTDGESHTTCTRADAYGRARQALPPTGPSVTYTYDELDRLTQALRGGATSSLSYDMAGRKTQMVDADLGTWSYAYDALGNLKRQTDARGQRICFDYDDLNRLTGKQYRTDDNCASGSPSVTYTYDAYDPYNGQYGRGRRTGMSDASGFTVWMYNERGLVTWETKSINNPGGGTFVTRYAYNSANLPVTMTYPGGNNGQSGETVAYTYLNQMTLNSLSSASATYVLSTSYDAAGRLDVRTLGNDLIDVDFNYYAWNQQGGRLQQISTSVGGVSTLQNLAYTYDKVGNVRTITDNQNSSQKQCFTYDALDRLTKATTYNDAAQGCTSQLGNGNYDEFYTYDSTTGNLSSKTGLGTYYYDANHPHAVLYTSGGWIFQYDANGNMTTRTAGSSYTLNYDYENRLISVSGGGISASFVYDGDGNRVQATVSGVTITFVGGGAYEWTANGNTVYYSAGGARVAMRRTGYATDNGLFWILGDHLGSTSIVANADGSLKSKLLYKAWGEVRYSTGVANTKYTFTGQYQHVSDFGLMYYVARWYDPALGRFAQADTVTPGGVQGLDRFAYVNNNPVIYNDPSGHDSNRDVCKHTACDENGDPINETVSTGNPTLVNPNDWGDPTGKDNDKKNSMTIQVWNKLCPKDNPGAWWWGCSDPKKLAAWLLQHELSILQNQDIYNKNIKYIETVIKDAVTYLHYILASLETNPGTMPPRLAEMTSFYNPEPDSIFNQKDMDWLMKEPLETDTAFTQVDRYWDSDYKRWEGKKLNWWMPREAGKGGAEYTIYDVKGDPLQYFQTVTFP